MMWGRYDCYLEGSVQESFKKDARMHGNDGSEESKTAWF